MSTILLDTSAYTLLSYGNSEALHHLQDSQQILLPTIVLGELYAGFSYGSKPEENRRVLTEFRRENRIVVTGLSLNTAEHYAQIYAHLRRTGKPIPTNDMWIAASALEHGARLLTGDGHFTNIPLLLLEYIQR